MKDFLLLTFCCVFLGASPALGEEPMPTILLTGFEPFGEGRPPNPSWEGIKALDGQTWKGHTLVARQLPVVWGAPLEKLQPWIEEYKPVAVLSFGQGGKYSLETKADNTRGRGKDNNGDLPVRRSIVVDGPESYDATINAKAIIGELAQRDYRVAISREAGNYLCEECLYSLEHLKRQSQREFDVLFCHIPPLKAKEYEPADAQRFVMAMLEAWHASRGAAKQPR